VNLPQDNSDYSILLKNQYTPQTIKEENLELFIWDGNKYNKVTYTSNFKIDA